MDEILQRQNEEAKEDRVDYSQVDEELVNDARNKRKRNRQEVDPRVRKVANDKAEDDDDFRMDLDKADKKFRVKRKKKHLFNDAGIKIEPFSMYKDADGNKILEEDGTVLARKNDDEEDDPWYESVREQQEKMLKQQAKDQIDSEESESESNGDDKQNEDQDGQDEIQPQEIDVNEVLKLK